MQHQSSQPNAAWPQIVTELQQRILDGTYPVGSRMPSEAQLSAEFGVSRPVIVRVLTMLRDEGWLTARQGYGRIVRQPGGTGLRQPGSGLSLVSDDGVAAQILDVTTLTAPARVLRLFDHPGPLTVVARRRLVTTGIGPVELSTTYIPAELADGTDLMAAKPVRGSLLTLLGQRRQLRFGRVTQRVSARPATTDEARLLDVAARSCLLTVVVCAVDAGDHVQVVTDALIPPTRRDLEDTFPV